MTNKRLRRLVFWTIKTFKSIGVRLLGNVFLSSVMTGISDFLFLRTTLLCSGAVLIFWFLNIMIIFAFTVMWYAIFTLLKSSYNFIMTIAVEVVSYGCLQSILEQSSWS